MYTVRVLRIPYTGWLVFRHDVLRLSTGGGGQVGGSPGEKGQEVEEERADSRIPKVAGTRRNLENFSNINFDIFLNRNGLKPLWKGVGSGRFRPPPSPSAPLPPSLPTTIL